MTTSHRRACTVLVASLLAAVGANAASIVGDAFELSVSFDDLAATGTFGAGPYAGTASGAPGAVFSASEADAAGDFVFEGSTLNAHALWVDQDTVHVFFQGDAVELTNLVFTLSGLDFQSTGQPVDISGATFNRNGGGGSAFGGFNEVILGIVSDPGITFTASAVTMTFSYFSANLVADGPVMEINVVAGVPAVPEPATYALLLGGLGVLGLVRARQRA